VDDIAEAGTLGPAGLEVLGGREVLPRLRGEGVDGVVFGFGDAAGRRALIPQIRAAGLELPVLIHSEASLADSAVVGDGSQVLALARVAVGAHVGKGVLVNTGAIVEHDVRVGDGASLFPGCMIASRVDVGETATIGVGAVVIPDMRIGAGATVGAGAVVIEEVPPDATVVGVPARPVRAQSSQSVDG
jgi:UDP-perosamine 4-acetyltransferase